jgi:cell division protein ZapA (FtsZ GTPase activity inhibitor)
MENHTIRIEINNRFYDMSVTAEEESRVRLAEQHINDKLAELRAEYGIHDTVDLLTMTMLTLVSERFEPVNQLQDEQTIVERAPQVSQDSPDVIYMIDQKLELLEQLLDKQ